MWNRPTTQRRLGKSWMLICAMVVLTFWACQSGCVRRRMMIRTNPPGAKVYIDDNEIGTTPIGADFVYYGTRKIRLVKDGYQTLTVMQPIPAPWYQYAPIDFVAENMVPGEIRDTRTLDFRLTPQVVVPRDELLGRAEDLRRGIHSRVGTVPSATLPPGQGGLPPSGYAPRGPTSSTAPANPSIPYALEPVPTPQPQRDPRMHSLPPGGIQPGTMPPGVGGQPVYPLPPGAR